HRKDPVTDDRATLLQHPAVMAVVEATAEDAARPRELVRGRFDVGDRGKVTVRHRAQRGFQWRDRDHVTLSRYDPAPACVPTTGACARDRRAARAVDRRAARAASARLRAAVPRQTPSLRRRDRQRHRTGAPIATPPWTPLQSAPGTSC